VIDELRGRVQARLAAQSTGVLSTNGRLGAWALPVRCRSCGLRVECLVPRWADALHHLADDARALLVLPEAAGEPLRWIEYRALASVVPGTADAPYVAVLLRPERIDLLDESRGWGARETLDCDPEETGGNWCPSA